MIDGYTTRDAVQMQAVICILRSIVNTDFPHVTKIVLQSDNASGYSCSEHIRTINRLNESSPALPIVTHWINTEAQKGKTALDAHFSYEGRQFQKYVSHTEERVFDALCYDGGITNSTAILADFSKLDKSVLHGSQFKSKSAVSTVHDIQWKMGQEIVELLKFSGYDVTETLDGSRKSSCLTNKKIGTFNVSISKQFKSEPPVVSVPRKYADRNYEARPKHQVIRHAFQAAGIIPAAQHTVQEENSSTRMLDDNIYDG